MRSVPRRTGTSRAAILVKTCSRASPMSSRRRTAGQLDAHAERLWRRSARCVRRCRRVPAREAEVNGIDLREKFATFSDHWNPRIVADLNGQHVKLVKFRGEFV